MRKVIESLILKPVDSVLESFPDKSSLKNMEKFASENNIPIIDRANGALLIDLIKFLQPLSILEIGTGLGFSTTLMNNCSKEETILVSVDHSYPSLLRAKHFCCLDNNKKIHFVHAEGNDILCSIQSKFDLIFIDCNKESYLELLYLGLEKLTQNGIMIFDNIRFHNKTRSNIKQPKMIRIKERIQTFLNELDKLKNIYYSILDHGDGLLIIEKHKTASDTVQLQSGTFTDM